LALARIIYQGSGRRGAAAVTVAAGGLTGTHAVMARE